MVLLKWLSANAWHLDHSQSTGDPDSHTCFSFSHGTYLRASSLGRGTFTTCLYPITTHQKHLPCPNTGLLQAVPGMCRYWVQLFFSIPGTLAVWFPLSVGWVYGTGSQEGPTTAVKKLFPIFVACFSHF